MTSLADHSTSELAGSLLNRFSHGKEAEKTAHLEYFAHHVAHTDENHFSLYRPQPFAGEKDYAQSCGTDVVEAREVKQQTLCTGIKIFNKYAFNLGRTRTVQATDRLQDQNVVDIAFFQPHGATRFIFANWMSNCKVCTGAFK